MAKTTQSKQKPENKNTESTNEESQIRPAVNNENGFFLNAANWLLSRLPWFNNHYQNWSKGKRILVGLLMYLIVLPVIPIVIGLILYIRNPESFKNGQAPKILGAITLLWLGAFGLVAMQPSAPDNPLNSTAKVDRFNKEQKASPEAKQQDNADSLPADKKGSSYQKVKDKSTSADTKGRFFKNCDAAFEVGVFNIPKSDSSYDARLDRDGDGIACEK